MSEEHTQGDNPMALITDPAARASSPGSGSAPKEGFAALVPELAVSSSLMWTARGVARAVTLVAVMNCALR